MFTRETLGVWEAYAWFPHLLVRARNGLAAALGQFVFPGRSQRRVRVPDMSEEWLAQHAHEAAKHAEDI